jgi:hypothetical protein
MTAAGTFLYIENWLLLSGGTLTGALFGTSTLFLQVLRQMVILIYLN